MKKIKKAIIPVAGNGTRFLPFTKTIPKEMLPIINRPTIEHIVDEAVASGIEEIIFISSANKAALVDYFDRNHMLERSLAKKDKFDAITEIVSPAKKAKFFWVRQHDALGLGHAVSLAAPLIDKDETFALLLGDDVIYHDNKDEMPALKELMEVYEKTGLSVLGVQEVPIDNISSYGVISPSEEVMTDAWKIKGVVEKPKAEDAPSNLAVVGRYLLNAKIFEYLLEHRVDRATNEIQITDSIEILAKSIGVTARKLSGIRYDMGSIKGFLKAQIEYAYRDPELKDDLLDIINGLNLKNENE